MAGVDDLIDHLLSEIALTGVQGMHDSRDLSLQHTCLRIDSRCGFPDDQSAPTLLHTAVAGSLTSCARTDLEIMLTSLQSPIQV